MNKSSARIDYGVDGYPYVIGLGTAGVLALVAGVFLAATVHAPWSKGLGVLLAVPGMVSLAVGMLGVRYVLIGKFVHRDRWIAMHAWRGDKQILDVGNGRRTACNRSCEPARG
jgi:arsenite methyltransferase